MKRFAPRAPRRPVRLVRSAGAGEAPTPRPSLPGVMQLIWRERQISRAEIARRTDLSRSTVSDVVSEILATGLVAEVGAGASKGGRRPIVLQFEDDGAVILGVDLGATHVAVALTDLRGAVLAWEYQKHGVRDDPAGAQALALAQAERCLKAWGGSPRRLLGIGVAVPCPVNPERPEAMSEVVLPAWRGVTVGEPLRRRFRVPLLIDNDANLGALAERWWGAGRDVQDFAYIKLATGIGSGFFIDGKLYRGANGLAGEIGHLSIDPHGEPCVCGLRGCLATLVGSRALVSRARALVPAHPESALASRDFGITIMEDAALAGDALALQVVREAAEHLGVAVADLINLLNPSVVIIGGGLARLGDLLLEPLRATVRGRTLVTSVDASRIVTSALGGRAVAVGAATLLLERALTDPRHFSVASAARKEVG
jgi:glucokinase-like ROK family protein